MVLPIFLAGSGRSGTSWIGETIASCSRCILVYEPMHRRVPSVPRWGRSSGLPGPYLRAGVSCPQWEEFFDTVFAGRVSNAWTRQDWARVPKILDRWPLAKRIGFRLAKMQYQCCEMYRRRYIIKEIRANLMLGWLASLRSAQIIYVTRHPCAVIGSRMNRLRDQELDWEVDTEEILSQAHLMSDFLEPFRTIISRAATTIERQAVLWCVENLVPLSQAGRRGWPVYSYEAILTGQDGGFGRIFRDLGLQPSLITDRVVKRVVCNPSHDATRRRPWYAPLTEAEGEEVLRTCEKFGLRIYGRQCKPLCSASEIPGRVLQGSANLG
jgi:hypothetical protein